MLTECRLCPHQCMVNRLKGEKGYCRAGKKVKIARAALHYWEEPCISGDRGSGTVFFSYCSIKCIYCQNYKISHEGFGKEIETDELSFIFLMLQEKGAHNINLVSPTHFIPQIKEAIIMARIKGLKIPIIYNSHGYENPSALQSLEGLIDVYLPDLKYSDNNLGELYSKAPSYFPHTSKAILEMYRQVGNPIFNKNGIIEKGLIVRHLVLPAHIKNTRKVLEWIANNLPKDIYVSLMAQYIPAYRAEHHPRLARSLTHEEYNRAIQAFWALGLENGFIQEITAASSEFVPPFDLTGIHYTKIS